MPGIVPPVATERDALLAYLEQQRYVVRLTAYGLDECQVRATPTPSALCLAAIVKHLAAVERSWTGTVREEVRDTGTEDYENHLRLAPHDTLSGVLEDYALAARETDELIASIDDMGRAVPVPPGVPWFPEDVEAWSVRWVVLHLIEETARHAGHADIIREAIDGATAFPLMAAAEGWPATPWITPWRAPK